MDQHDQKTSSCQISERADSGSSAQMDLSVYMPALQSLNISEQEKLELLQSLCAIAASIIQLGFPIAFRWGGCGQIEKLTAETSAALADHVNSTHEDIIEEFGSLPASGAEDAEEGVEA